MIWYALSVEFGAVAVVAATAALQPVGQHDWVRFAVLAACAIAHIELSGRRIERRRDLGVSTGPIMTYDSVWCIAAVMALPMAVADLIVVIVLLWSWLRVWRGRRPLYRTVFNTVAVMLATEAAATVLAVGGQGYPGLSITPAALGVAVAAAVVRWLVNFGLVAGAVLLSTPGMRARRLLTGLSDRVLEVGAIGFGIITAALLTESPLLLVGMVAGVASTHRVLLVAELRHAAHTDGKTGLTNAARWQELAADAFRRATGSGLGVLMLDLDHFKRVNDTYGHLAGDHVLRAVATTVASGIRAQDTAGRWGGEEFTVLMPGVDVAELVAVAERIRRRVHELVVRPDRATVIRDLTISIGAACLPDPAITSVDELVKAADAALYVAKTHGRDQVRLADGSRSAMPESSALHVPIEKDTNG